MNKIIKRLSLKNILFLLIVFTIFISNLTLVAVEVKDEPLVTANGKLEEVTVKVSISGIRTDDADYLGNTLTQNSDFFLRGDNLYTSDSVTSNDFNGVKPGDTVTGEVGYIPVDTAGNVIESMPITLQLFENVTKDMVAEKMYSSFGNTSMTLGQITEMVNSYDDYLACTFGTYNENKISAEIVFENGNWSLTLPDDIPDNYVVAITEMYDPITGKMVRIGEYRRLFLALGDGSESDPLLDRDKDNPPPPPPPGEDPEPEGEDDGKRYCEIDKSFISYAHQIPETSASIYSASPEDYYYDVASGVPTSENLKYTVSADNALYDIYTRQINLKAGVRDIKIQAYADYEYTYTWTTTETNASGEKYKKKHSEKRIASLPVKTVVSKYSTSHSVTIYDVPISNIYPVLNGSVQAQNGAYVLSGGSLTLQGSDTPGGQVQSYDISTPDVGDTYTYCIGTYSSKNEAKNALNSCNGSEGKAAINALVVAAIGPITPTVNYSYQGLSVSTYSHNNIKPVPAKASATSSPKMIPENYINGLYVGSGTVTYTNTTAPCHPNNVTVHTPVLNESKVTKTSKFINQKVNKDSTKKYLMLDEEFTIEFPNQGNHINIKGYGNRKYNSYQAVPAKITNWGKIKDVKLPFDAYLHYTKNGYTYKYFVKKDTWLSESGASSVIGLSGSEYIFTVPVWAQEGDCIIQTRVIAENATDYSLTAERINNLTSTYVATNNIPVEVIGKIYDLRISSSNDPGWYSIYSWKNKRSYIAADEFPFGAQGQNSNTAYKYAPKLGYTFVFDFKTKGTKSNNIDVSVQPEGFYFVSRDGKNTQPVNLYYDTTAKKNIKIDSFDNNMNLSVKLSEAYLKVAAQEFVDSTRIYNNKYNYSLAVNIGNFAKMNLPHSLRLCYNNFAEYIGKLYGRDSTENSISNNAGARDTVIGAVGHWYAGYRLPASTKAVPVTTDINTAIKNNAFLTDGYIVVKFGIKTQYKNNSGNYEYLEYMGPEAMNEAGDNTGILIVDWTKEGNQDIILPNGNPAKVPIGSVAIFDANLRSSTNDLEVGGTH